MAQSFQVGEDVLVPCNAQPGALPGEQLVTIPIDGGTIDGFVRQETLRAIGGRTFVVGRIVKVEEAALFVRFAGSFFTKAAGVTQLSPSWAEANLRAA